MLAEKLNAANALEDHAEAKEALNTLHRELVDLNPSAARSLGEGLEETLIGHRLHVPPQLRKTLASTNVIDSAFSIVERVCANVKRWHAAVISESAGRTPPVVWDRSVFIRLQNILHLGDVVFIEFRRGRGRVNHPIIDAPLLL